MCRRAVARLGAVAAVVAAAGCGGGAPGRPPARPAGAPAPRRVLVLTATAGYRHASIPAAAALLRDIDRRDPGLAMTFLAQARAVTPARLRGASALVFLQTSGELPWSAAQRRAFLRFVRGGGGFLGVHAAADTFKRWPAYGRLLGGVFASHPYRRVGRIVVEDRAHPATRRLPRTLRSREEFYFFRRNPRPRVHVLARLDLASVGGAPGGDRPLIWWRCEGRGRVFYSALGHFTAAWHSRLERALMTSALSWVTGRAPRPGCP